jgi:aryl-alcohol dehydrogenase-like predicted oxidoreductase
MAELRGWSRFVGLQIRYSLIDRTAEADLLPMARAFDMAVTPWSILGAGVLSGKYNQAKKPKEGRAKDGAGADKRNLKIAKTVTEVAGQIGCTPSQVAIAWVRQQPGLIVPLLGARNTRQLKDNLGALDVILNKKQMDQLNQVSAVDLGFPHNFLAEDYIRDIVYGGTYNEIDNHRKL